MLHFEFEPGKASKLSLTPDLSVLIMIAGDQHASTADANDANETDNTVNYKSPALVAGASCQSKAGSCEKLTRDPAPMPNLTVRCPIPIVLQ